MNAPTVPPAAAARVQGRHWLIDAAGCGCAPAMLDDAARLEPACVAACKRAGMAVLGATFHQFAGGGVTGVVLLAESHLSIHTWPAERFAALDVYVCNHEADNTAKGWALAGAMQALLAPARAHVREVARDSAEETPQAGEARVVALPAAPPPDAAPPDAPWRARPATRDVVLLREPLNDDYAFEVRGERVCPPWQSPYQQVELLRNATFGTLLRLDGALQCSERDEFLYHEPLVHMALAAVARPRRVCIVGGGDGGAAEEALKWPALERLDHVEIDPDVVALAREHLQAVHRGVLDGCDARHHLHVEDALAWLRRAGEGAFDAIVLDLTDAGGPSSALYDADFYRLCASRLAPGGALTLHLAAPWFQAAAARATLQRLGAAFASIEPYVATVPAYGGPWLMARCRRAGDGTPPDLATLHARLATLQGPPLRALDAQAMHALTHLAPWLRESLALPPHATEA